MIDKEEVRRIARLAHLEFPKSEADRLYDDAMLEALAADIRQILDHVRELFALDVSGVEPTSHGVPLPTKLRDDEPHETLPTERAVAAAPSHTGEAICVPKIVE